MHLLKFIEYSARHAFSANYIALIYFGTLMYRLRYTHYVVRIQSALMSEI